jgi:hypothetical protein
MQYNGGVRVAEGLGSVNCLGQTGPYSTFFQGFGNAKRFVLDAFDLMLQGKNVVGKAAAFTFPIAESSTKTEDHASPRAHRDGLDQRSSTLPHYVLMLLGHLWRY